MTDYTEDEFHIRLALKCAHNKCRHCMCDYVYVCLTVKEEIKEEWTERSHACSASQ